MQEVSYKLEMSSIYRKFNNNNNRLKYNKNKEIGVL